MLLELLPSILDSFFHHSNIIAHQHTDTARTETNTVQHRPRVGRTRVYPLWWKKHPLRQQRQHAGGGIAHLYPLGGTTNVYPLWWKII